MAARQPTIRERHGHAILERYQQRLLIGLPGPRDPSSAAAAPSRRLPADFTVGIVGAGVAGLYAAMILQDLGIKYEILEASPRVGGRLFTHRFGEKPNDYYDVGAMRFPDIPLMESTFNLFKILNYDKNTLIPYHMSTPKDIRLFNGFFVTGPIPSEEDPFHVSETKGGLVPDQYASQGYQHWLDEKLDRFKLPLAENFPEGWKELMRYDGHSFRTYMTTEEPKYPNSVVDWCETMDSGTSLFDGALTEAVVEALDFDFPQDQVNWFCVQGGAQKIAEDMARTLNEPIKTFNSRVTSISRSPLTVMPPKMQVSVHGQHAARSYNHVISTIPLSALRMVDTEKCNLTYGLKTAMRMLHYGGSVKVGIQFTDRWWEPDHKGGISRTDRQTRIVVYPSYGIDNSASGTTILVSYTWGQDALRQGALVGSANETLLKLILEDLAVMHRIPYDTLKGKVTDFHEWNWYGDPFSVGAFAHFGPGQFSTLYEEVTQPAVGGIFHIAGEAASVNHAWVAGALDSAFRCVAEIIMHELFANSEDLFREANKRRQGGDWSLGVDPSHPILELLNKLRKKWGERSQEFRLDLSLRQLALSRASFARSSPK